jgi:hypothetical protein
VLPEKCAGGHRTTAAAIAGPAVGASPPSAWWDRYKPYCIGQDLCPRKEMR